MATIAPSLPTRGRADHIHTELQPKMVIPEFVDNTVLHAEYIRQSDLITGTTLQIQPPTIDDFQYVSDKTYRIIETQDGLRIAHNHKYGNRYDGPVFFNGVKLDSTDDVPPLLLFGTQDTSKRLVPYSVETSSYGTLLPLPNMKGRTLKDVEFEESTVRAGQTVGVGYRTTDAVQHLMKGAFHSLNSFDVGLSFSGPRAGKSTMHKGADLSRHSNRFIAQDFYGIGIIQGIKYIARHDNHTLYMDRFSNLLYAPSVFSITSREMGEAKGIGGIKSKPLLGRVNRIISSGVARGLNDNNQVIVDDLELQKKHGNIKTTEIYNPLAKTLTQSRRSAAEMLRMNKKAQRVIQSSDHVNSWDLDPGDVVSFKAPSSGISKNVAILEAEHSLREHSSNFVLMSNEAGIESLLATTESAGRLQTQTQDRSFMEPTIEISNTGSMNIFVTPMVGVYHYGSSQIRGYSMIGGNPPKTILNSSPNRHAGALIGHRYNNKYEASRGAIGVGASLSTSASAYTHIGTKLTVTSTDGFPSSGWLIVQSYQDTTEIEAVAQRPLSALLKYTAIYSSTQFTIDISGASAAAGAIQLSANLIYSPHARVINARPRSHEMRMSRSVREVVM